MYNSHECGWEKAARRLPLSWDHSFFTAMELEKVENSLLTPLDCFTCCKEHVDPISFFSKPTMLTCAHMCAQVWSSGVRPWLVGAVAAGEEPKSWELRNLGEWGEKTPNEDRPGSILLEESAGLAQGGAWQGSLWPWGNRFSTLRCTPSPFSLSFIEM